MAAGTGGEVSSLEARSRPMRFLFVRQSGRKHFDYRPSPKGLRRGGYNERLRLTAYCEVFALTLGRRPALSPAGKRAYCFFSYHLMRQPNREMLDRALPLAALFSADVVFGSIVLEAGPRVMVVELSLF